MIINSSVCGCRNSENFLVDSHCVADGSKKTYPSLASGTSLSVHGRHVPDKSACETFGQLVPTLVPGIAGIVEETNMATEHGGFGET